MIASHPYNTWPLRVKLFTDDAAKLWLNGTRDNNQPPIGVSVELEGVDGKSGQVGSGRIGPIEVLDRTSYVYLS